jgi:hypothetical protein
MSELLPHRRTSINRGIRTVLVCLMALNVIGSLSCRQSPSESGGVTDLSGRPADPLTGSTNIVVLVFVRPDCPIANRYAPEIRRLHEQFGEPRVSWRMVYPDAETLPEEIKKHMAEYRLPGEPLKDSQHALVRLANARVTPDVAVFQEKRLVYHGRIDDRYVALGSDRGVATRHELQEVLEAAVAGRPVTTPPVSGIGCTISAVP